jgi:acetone carboxylase gamma subunit
VRDRLEDLWTWLKRKACRHPKDPVYEEVCNKEDRCFRWYWSAFYVCPDCGELLSVEASFYGNPYDVAIAVDELIEKPPKTEGRS